MSSLYMFHEHTFTDNCKVIKQSAIHFIGLDSIVTGWKEFCKIFNIALIEKKKTKHAEKVFNQFIWYIDQGNGFVLCR